MRVDEGAWTAAAVVVTAFWVVAALAGGDLSPVDTTATGAAAAAGAAAVAGAAWGFQSISPVWLAGLTLVLVPVGTAAAAGASGPVLPVVLVVLAAGEVVSALVGPPGQGAPPATGGDPGGAPRRGEVWAQAGLVLVAAALLGGALASRPEGDDGLAFVADRGTAAWLGLVAAAVLLGAAGFGPVRGRAYAVPGLAVGLVVAPGLPPVGLAVAGGSAALLCATFLGSRPGVALGFLGLGAAAFSAGRPAVALLLAGAALALSYGGDHPVAGVLALPGAAALTAEAVVAGGDEAAPMVLAAAAAMTGALLALSTTQAMGAVQVAPVRAPQAGRVPWAALPAALLSVWLLVAPGTWTWTGASGLGPFDKGAAPAFFFGCAVVALRAAWPAREQPEPREPFEGAARRSAWSLSSDRLGVGVGRGGER